MSGYRVKRMPIFRIGWREALELIETEDYTLQVFKTGTAELLGPSRMVSGGHHPSYQSGRCAEYYLTVRSVELLQAAQEKP